MHVLGALVGFFRISGNWLPAHAAGNVAWRGDKWRAFHIFRIKPRKAAPVIKAHGRTAKSVAFFRALPHEQGKKRVASAGTDIFHADRHHRFLQCFRSIIGFIANRRSVGILKTGKINAVFTCPAIVQRYWFEIVAEQFSLAFDETAGV